MVVGDASINSIMSGIENTGGVKQHNHKKKLKQRFDIIKKLGQGTFGKVQLGINKETGQEVAIKTIKKSKIESEADLIRIRREIQIMSSVQHPNIIHIYEVFENREKMVLVMEYAAGGELYDYLSERKVLTEEEARRIFRQIATACYYCHKHKICHRDLKLENILLDENNNAKIADFGLSNVFDNQRLLGTFCGSPLYASPEIVKGTPYHGPEVDCWSLGVLLYTLVYGAMPFDGSNFKRLVKQISQGDYFEPAKPSPASPLIRDMLTVNPKKRSNIEQICSHWWVNQNYDVDCLEISEELANQTPVRLDLLLSLAPPPPQLESDKLLVTADVADEMKTDMTPPTRSQSAGSLMELSHPEKRIKDLLNEDKASPKRKLESTVSTDRIKERKDKIIKENTVADITLHGTIAETSEAIPLDKSATQTISREMDVEDPNLQGAACAEIIEEAKAKEPIKTPSQDDVVNKENIEQVAQDDKPEAKKKIKKKVLTDKNETVKKEEEPTKPVERRKSKIFEAAEKFQNMITPTETKPIPIEKPKKIVIPGVSVDGFKKEFERKASLTSTSPPKSKTPVTKKILIDQQKEPEIAPAEPETEEDKNGEVPPETEMKERVRNAVSIITSALDKEGARKSKSRPCCMRKPPVPFGVSGRSASGNIGLLTSSPKPFVKPLPEVKKVEEQPEPTVENKTSIAEITLKSATLPRRKTAKAEIQLNYPAPKPATMEFKTEMAHNVAAAPQTTQRSEVVVPVTDFKQSKSKERIIPIAFEDRESGQSPPVKPPVVRPFNTQKSNQSQRSGSLSRQSTQESDTETTSASGEPIKKSPREYIIPIAVEGGGYVTPRAGSLEPSETASTTSTMTSRGRNKFGKARRMNSLLNDSEDESNIRRSFGKDSDTEDSRKDLFHFHRLRSTRPDKPILEHTDSLSSGEEDDDDGFEILTAEHLFSNLLSRVRDLTQKLDVEDGGRPGFPSSHLLRHLDHGTNFWNMHSRLSPLSRHTSFGRTLSRDNSDNSAGPTPWRRSVSRDLASDIESVFKDNNNTTPRPRGDRKSKKENLNLADLDLKKLKLSDEDALALSYLTPGLSRRIQKQLLAQLAPQLQRTLSANENRSIPRRYSNEPTTQRRYSVEPETVHTKLNNKSNLPRRDEVSELCKPKRTFSLREPKIYPTKDRSPESSLTDTYSTDSSSLNKYLNKPTMESKLAQPRRISRFLRPDFYDPPKEDNILVKEKKEREMETQKVLKEIRDKRKFRLNAMRRSREKSVGPDPERFVKEDSVKETDYLLNNVSNNIKNIEDNCKTIHDYVNVKTPKEPIHDYVNVKAPESVKKSRISKLVRPKSYPTDTTPLLEKTSPEKTSKSRKGSKERDEVPEKSHRNRILQSIEKKLEKFRSKEPDKKSTVESAIKRLREQSLPRNLEHCTESGLIKRAVSVEDLTVNDKPLQTSRKSVTRILGLFKKYEDQDKSKEKDGKKKKDSKSPPKVEAKKPERPKSLNIDKVKNGEKNDTKVKSKLPVNNFRRSLNLEQSKTSPETVLSPSEDNHRNSVMTDDSSVFLSPNDDRSDTWSQCSDLNSPTNGYHNLCSGDESSESVIDRIRRKSFYTRFNEKKRTRKPRNYKELDLYKDVKPNDNYGSLDRKYDYRTPSARRSSYLSALQEPVIRDYKLNDYVNVPNRYQTYSSKIGSRGNVYGDEDLSLDEVLAGKSRNSRYGTRSVVSPSSEYYRATASPAPPMSESHLLN